MQFTELEIPGLFLVNIDWIGDDRGGFAKVFSHEQLTHAGLHFDVVDHNLSRSSKAGTIRGLHYQADPHAEVKFIRCTRGALLDVAVDMRPHSPTYGRWSATELTPTNDLMLYVSKGLAHGFQTLVDDTEALYYSSHEWAPGSERGVRWDDPAIGVEWPLDPGNTMSVKDRSWPDVTLTPMGPV